MLRIEISIDGYVAAWADLDPKREKPIRDGGTVDVALQRSNESDPYARLAWASIRFVSRPD